MSTKSDKTNQLVKSHMEPDNLLILMVKIKCDGGIIHADKKRNMNNFSKLIIEHLLNLVSDQN